MGGFAGEGVVPSELIMEKFKGVTTCQSWNLSSTTGIALKLQKYSGIKKRFFISKNVTHRVIYDKKIHSVLNEAKNYSKSIKLIWQGMDVYLKKHAEGKKIHDLLAAVCAIDESVCKFIEVELYHEKKNHFVYWGSKAISDSKTWISIDYDHEKFLKILLEY
jgi:pyrimidine-specific ribonucleoside hydrolase